MDPGRQSNERGLADQPDGSIANAPPRRVGIREILGGAREAIIEFNGASYRLRITRNQRLILTK